MPDDPKEMIDMLDEEKPEPESDEDSGSYDIESKAGQSRREKLQQAWEEAQDGTSRPIPPMPRPTASDEKREKR
jgi:hypothetical protein